MRTKEEIEKNIAITKSMIQTEESINKDSGNLSFLYWQLSELEKELRDSR